jgi:hypothetical protein
VTSDPCSLSTQSDFIQHIRVRRSDDGFTIQVEGQPCSTPVFTSSRAAGDGYDVEAITTSTFAYNGCNYQRRTMLSVTITQDTIQGTILDRGLAACGYTANCPRSCAVSETVQGQCCDDCFEGCP